MAPGADSHVKGAWHRVPGGAVDGVGCRVGDWPSTPQVHGTCKVPRRQLQSSLSGCTPCLGCMAPGGDFRVHGTGNRQAAGMECLPDSGFFCPETYLNNRCMAPSYCSTVVLHAHTGRGGGTVSGVQGARFSRLQRCRWCRLPGWGLAERLLPVRGGLRARPSVWDLSGSRRSPCACVPPSWFPFP